ncbi:VWA domain-containing protein [Frankia sp. AgB1.9]|uniref:GDSL-type esterase/lipase family protein n=1 Tax=unclassified Frankia TaxID=2632575 RepID=UPI001932DEBC|nr:MULTISPECIES: GDSL-type esterase/lipase family protein [unclassified Frankia]MBL7490359.1 VWA domain-containing protein [Frankia sp. AgW1.1]MBL7548469.1 VWA domain-containing protein [Frankia sp. AgB1.9]MBL7621359.1 VWA domain-containing protein [Frankia sp. AgB1.8]
MVAVVAVLATTMTSLVTAASAASAATPTRAVALVVDVSGSMAGAPLGQAQAALTSSVDGLRSTDSASLRSFAGDCGDGGQLLVPSGTDNRDAMRAAIDGLVANGGTPTPDALRAAVTDFPAGIANRVVILVSDGESTCGDPCPVAQQLAASANTAFTAYTVGFRADGSAEDELSCIAHATGGQYYSASDTAGLQKAINSAIQAAGPATYVALGDSYSSGEGNAPFDSGTDKNGGLGNNAPGSCHRSQVAWPRAVAAATGLGLEAFLACSGATTDALTRSFKGEAGQITAMVAKDPSPDLITITMGGNDIGFAGVVAACRLNGHGAGCSTAIGLASLAAAFYLPAKLKAAYAALHAAAPNAQILVVGYPNIMGNGVTSGIRCPWIDGTHRVALRTLASGLDSQIRSVVQSMPADDHVQYVSTLNALSGHELCTGDSWVNSIPYVSDPNRSAHPTKNGQNAMATTVASYIKAHYAGLTISIPNF